MSEDLLVDGYDYNPHTCMVEVPYNDYWDMKDKCKEIKRLNNIIDELEKCIKNRIKDRQEEKQDFEEDLKFCDYEVRTTNYNEITIRHNEILELEDILDKIKELKGSDKE